MTFLYLGVLVVAVVPLSVMGFRRHRHTWTPRAWRHFAGAFVLSLVPSVAGVLLAQRVDHVLPFGGTPSMRELLGLALFLVALFAICVPMFLLSWFAMSESAREFDRRQSSGGHSPNTR
jgi:hypothetical protein